MQPMVIDERQGLDLYDLFSGSVDDGTSDFVEVLNCPITLQLSNDGNVTASYFEITATPIGTIAGDANNAVWTKWDKGDIGASSNAIDGIIAPITAFRAVSAGGVCTFYARAFRGGR